MLRDAMGDPAATAGFGRTSQSRCHDPGSGPEVASQDRRCDRDASSQAEVVRWLFAQADRMRRQWRLATEKVKVKVKIVL